MDKIYYPVMVLLAVLVILGFFLPWVQVESGQVEFFRKALGGKQEGAITKISGFQIPVLANGEEAKLMISIIKIFNPGITNADKKSYLVWSLPILALVILGVAYIWSKDRWIFLAFGVIGVLIFIVPVIKIATTNLDKVVLKIVIREGLWIIFLAYFGIGIAGFLRFLQLSKGKSGS